MVELWDAYNEKEELLGIDLVRGEKIPEGMYHLVVEVLIKHVDGDYLLTQRDFNKMGWPGYWEATAGGSATKGDTPETGIRREAFEEVGIELSNLELISKHIDCSAIYYNYLSVVDCDKNSIALQEGETIDYKWVNEEEFVKFMNSDDCIPSQKERLIPYLKSLKI